jgi:hypothetical protein
LKRKVGDKRGKQMNKKRRKDRKESIEKKRKVENNRGKQRERRRQSRKDSVEIEGEIA